MEELALCRRVVVLEPGLNGLVLLVELRQVGDKVLDDVHYRVPSMSKVREEKV